MTWVALEPTQRRLLGRLAGLTALAPALWWVTAVVLSTDRGLDLTDEGFYLLEADPPSPTAAWSFPYGWHTGVLLRSVGGDIVRFRTLGAVLLALASMWLAWEAWSYGRASVATPCTSTREWAERLAQGCVLGAGLAAALQFYAWLLLTPGYNWLNVFGATIAAGGLLRLLRRTPPDLAAGRVRRLVVTVVVGGGLFLTVPAKPTTPVLFSLVVAVLLWPSLGAVRVLRLVTGIALAAVVWLLVALLVGLWPIAFFDVFLRAVEAPGLRTAQTIPGAIETLLYFPLVALENPTLMSCVAVALTSILIRRWPELNGGRSLLLMTTVATTAVLLILLRPVTLLAEADVRPALLRMIILADRYVLAMAAAAAAVSILLVLIRERTGSSITPRVLLLMGALVAFSATGAESWGLEQLGRPPNPHRTIATTMLCLVLLACVAWSHGAARDTQEAEPSAGMSPDGSVPSLAPVGPVAGILLATAIATGFGSGNGPYWMSGKAAPPAPRRGRDVGRRPGFVQITNGDGGRGAGNVRRAHRDTADREPCGPVLARRTADRPADRPDPRRRRGVCPSSRRRNEPVDPEPDRGDGGGRLAIGNPSGLVQRGAREHPLGSRGAPTRVHTPDPRVVLSPPRVLTAGRRSGRMEGRLGPDRG